MYFQQKKGGVASPNKKLAPQLMKNRWFLTASIGMVFSFNSCEENFVPEKADVRIELQSYENQVAFVEQHLKTLGQSILSMVNDLEFREIVYQQIEKRVDGDDNVLIETLSKIPTSSRKTIGARMDESVNIEGNVGRALAQFKGIEGRDLYPQIYIPFYENVKQRREANPQTRLALVQESPKIVLYDGDETQTVFKGYYLNDSGELTESNLEIDEEYAENNEVWVISLNENIDDANSTTSTLSSPSAKIDKVRIKCHKESWVAGASEVHIITWVSSYRFYDLEILLYNGGDYEGGRIKKISRSDVKDKKMHDINFNIVKNWNDKAPLADYAHYVIFEYDAWPTRKRDVKWTQGGDELIWEYRSSDDYYDKNTVYKGDFLNYYVNKGCIEWFGLYQ